MLVSLKRWNLKLLLCRWNTPERVFQHTCEDVIYGFPICHPTVRGHYESQQSVARLFAQSFCSTA